MWHVSGYAETTEQRTDFGSISLIEEIRTRDPGEPPIIHAKTEGLWLRLRWTSDNGNVVFELVDDGSNLQMIEVTAHRCLSTGRFQRLPQKTGEPKLWALMREQLARILEDCPRITEKQAKVYIKEFRVRKNDFIAGIEELKNKMRNVYPNRFSR